VTVIFTLVDVGRDELRQIPDVSVALNPRRRVWLSVTAWLFVRLVLHGGPGISLQQEEFLKFPIDKA
jgi:hypothetical protein